MTEQEKPARPTAKEYLVSDYDLGNVVYQGYDLDAALAAWDAAQYPECWVNEVSTYRLALRPTQEEASSP